MALDFLYIHPIDEIVKDMLSDESKFIEQIKTNAAMFRIGRTKTDNAVLCDLIYRRYQNEKTAYDVRFVKPGKTSSISYMSVDEIVASMIRDARFYRRMQEYRSPSKFKNFSTEMQMKINSSWINYNKKQLQLK